MLQYETACQGTETKNIQHILGNMNKVGNHIGVLFGNEFWGSLKLKKDLGNREIAQQ